MNLKQKIKKLNSEAQEIVNKKNQAQKLVNQYDVRLIEISGALKVLDELGKEEASKVEPVKDDNK